MDEKLHQRVKDMVTSLSSGTATVVTAEQISESLRKKHPEYARRPFAAMMALTERSLVKLGLRNGSPNEPSSGSEEEEDDVELIETPPINPLNNALVDFYKRSSSAVGAQEQPKKRKAIATAAKRGALANALRQDFSDVSPADGSGAPTASAPPSVRYSDLGGIEGALQDVRELIEYPLTHPEIYTHLGVDPPRGILLHGPPGCGKTMLAHAIAGELGVPFFSLAAPEIVSGMSGESEAKLRALFAEAARNAPTR